MNATAREALRGVGWAEADWLARYPGCDACGCPDDRCIGFHHTDPDECYCLAVEIDHIGIPNGC